MGTDGGDVVVVVNGVVGVEVAGSGGQLSSERCGVAGDDHAALDPTASTGAACDVDEVAVECWLRANH